LNIARCANRQLVSKKDFLANDEVAAMSASAVEPVTTQYATREVVGVFASAEALDGAIQELGFAGVNRAAISVLGVAAPRHGHVDAIYRSAQAISDDPLAQQAAFISRGSLAEAGAVAIAGPLMIGGFTGAWAVAAAGGALLTAIGATVMGGALGAGLGALVCHAVSRRHAAKIEAELAGGGLILWVRTPDRAAEIRAFGVLSRCGGASVHAHTIDRPWGSADMPLHDFQPDPLLENDALS
jgi:hypothetical protein